MKLCLAIIFSLFTTSFCYAQLQGFWQGYITADDVSYKAYYAINITEQSGDMIYGTAYLDRSDIAAYGLVSFAGSVNKNQILFTELQIIDNVVPMDLAFCMKFCTLTLNENSDPALLTGRWKGDNPDCLPGEVYLRKINDPTKSRDSVPSFVYNDITAPIQPRSFIKRTLPDPVIIPIKYATVLLQLSDYLKTDNDTVSIYANRAIFKSKIPITKKVKTYKLKLNPYSSVNEIILVAENLGDIPPNTSLLTIIDGDERHEVRIETSLQKNAVIYLKPKKLVN